MRHFYESIPGNFTFEALYSYAAKCSLKCVEIGVANGRSAAYLAVELANNFSLVSDVRPRLGLVELHQSNLGAAMDQVQKVPGVDFQGLCGNSWEMASAYQDGELDFVFIDGEHAYDGVSRDIKAWLPKVKPNGILAGHDYVVAEWSGVIQAVTEAFPKVEVWRGSQWEDGKYYPSWMVRT